MPHLPPHVDDALPVQQFSVKLNNYQEVMAGIIAGFVTCDDKKTLNFG
jgi:hypothetical protein